MNGTVEATYVMLHMAEPTSTVCSLWKLNEWFYTAYNHAGSLDAITLLTEYPAPETSAPETEAPIVIPTIQPEGDRVLVLDGRANGWAQRPAFTDNGDGTFSVVCKDGAENVKSWTDNYLDGQFTNQNTEGQVWWNNYFPRVYYSAGVTATELVWNVHQLTDVTDIADFEVWYSDDTNTWKKAEGVTIALYNPAGANGGTEIDPSCGATYGVRFIFAEPITAKCFFAFDPNPAHTNIFHYSAFFVAVEAPAPVEETAKVVEVPAEEVAEAEAAATEAETILNYENEVVTE
jgi:hypothetical protein